jgi:hypothetical protein
VRSNLKVKPFGERRAVPPLARLVERLPAMRVLAPPPVRQSAGRLVESVDAEQGRRPSNNRHKRRRRLPAVRIHTIERSRRVSKGVAIPSIERGVFGNSRHAIEFANTDLLRPDGVASSSQQEQRQQKTNVAAEAKRRFIVRQRFRFCSVASMVLSAKAELGT